MNTSSNALTNTSVAGSWIGTIVMGSIILILLIFIAVTTIPKTTSPVQPVGSVTTSNITNSTVMLNWTASPSASSYVIQSKLKNASTYMPHSTTSQLTLPITGLSGNTEYSFQVAAQNLTDSISEFKSIDVLTVPGAPQDVELVSPSPSSILISWVAMEDVTSYSISSKISGATNFLVLGTSSTSSYTASDLNSNTEYVFKITATNASGTGPESSAATYFTLAVAPSSLTVTDITASQITFGWSEVLGVTSYSVFMKPESTNLFSPFKTVTTGRTVTADNLDVNTQYVFRVSSNNSAGIGPASSNLSIVTSPDVMNLSVSNATTSSIQLNWITQPHSTHYLVQYKPNTDTTWSSSITVNGVQYVQTGLVGGTVYDFRIAGANGTEVGPFSPPFSMATISTAAPVKVENLHTTSIVSGAISLAWDGIVTNPQFEIEFRITPPIGQDPAWTQIGTQATTTITATGLAGLVQYDFRVRAVNTVASGPYSSVLTVLSSVLLPATAPSNVIVVVAYFTSISLSWDPWIGATGYSVQYKTSSASVYQTITTTAAAANITGLTLSTYSVRVAAVNQAGVGVYSSVLPVTVIEAPLPTASVVSGSDYFVQTVIHQTPNVSGYKFRVYYGGNLLSDQNVIHNIYGNTTNAMYSFSSSDSTGVYVVRVHSYIGNEVTSGYLEGSYNRINIPSEVF